MPSELETRIAAAETSANRNPGMSSADWLTLALTAIAIPALILVVGWGR
ncbi:MAG: hypothetical protein R3D57_08910 [Hyphomicrobiaceae bacterium]